MRVIENHETITYSQQMFDRLEVLLAYGDIVVEQPERCQKLHIRYYSNLTDSELLCGGNYGMPGYDRPETLIGQPMCRKCLKRALKAAGGMSLDEARMARADGH